MQSAWIRRAGLVGAAALLAAACSVEDDRLPASPSWSVRPLGSGSSVGGAASSSSSSSSSSSTGGGGASSSSSSSSSSTGGGGGASASSSTGVITMTNLVDGAICTLATECLSASCVDGVCCDQPCNGVCEACTAMKKGSGVDGACGSIAQGADPDVECAPAPICGNTGFCSGSGSCEQAAAATSCAACSVTPGFVDQSNCDGSGTCLPPMPMSCGLYQCSAAACLTICKSDGDCVSTAFCNGGACALKQDPGSACAGPNGCTSGFCADSVCCDAACTGACVACTNAKKGNGSDGVCGNIAAATDPDDECSTQQIPCDGTGLCDGAGACGGKKALSYPCAPGSCDANGAAGPSVCDGNGTCNTAQPSPCALGCNGTVCKATCADDTPCLPNGYCKAMSCVAKQPTGATCTGPSQCQTGFCADGFCCDSACNGGACQACAKSKGASSDGACTPLNGPAPAGACDDGVKCTDDLCNGGACAHPPKVCAPASPCMVAGTCDASSGVCGPATPLACPMAAKCTIAGACDAATGLCAAPSPVACGAATDACHVAPTCDPGTDTCGAESPKICPTNGLGVCETRLCDVTAKGACVVRSRLDGAPCKASGSAGICVAGSCFTVTGSNGNGGAGGAPATSSAATGASSATGAGGEGGAGGGGRFHFAGGGCDVVNDVNTEKRSLGWLLVGLLFAARGLPRRGARSSRRGSRDA